MVIKASSAAQIEALVGDLGSASAARREAAIARLTIIGARAVGRLGTLLDSDAGSVARLAALRTLEAIGDPHALHPALGAIDRPEADVASAGISVARAFLRGPQSEIVVDRLTAIALDPARIERVRLSALQALADLKHSTIAPLLDALRNDPNDAVRRAAARSAAAKRDETFDPAAVVRRAADEELPDDPTGLQRAVALAGERVGLSQLLRVIERIREREPSEEPGRRIEWTSARGAAHVALARRNSRIAVYDLRESIESASSPLPVEFLAALSTIGDTSCLEGLASAYAQSLRSGRSRRDWWHQHLAAVFHSIVKRERVTRRHAIVKKMQKRWPEALAELLHKA
ncbi:MAG: hypothetical protein A3G76_12865 [Acidobacteria bacterium RIFCSPLOWO2_12_FULL_65_11]|nr:MAG: hypothetical protein A3H95_07910 [Acidobacteria bacterium RIFCSPLOWO2_02_FULL_64_15]OFW29987.1 MAG: hypothetical protein A3G76_12865 [Acidobacteria bacterium RIFCSPLOWO2_12_FULL_65_11]